MVNIIIGFATDTMDFTPTSTFSATNGYDYSFSDGTLFTAITNRNSYSISEGYNYGSTHKVNTFKANCSCTMAQAKVLEAYTHVVVYKDNALAFCGSTPTFSKSIIRGTGASGASESSVDLSLSFDDYSSAFKDVVFSSDETFDLYYTPSDQMKPYNPQNHAKSLLHVLFGYLDPDGRFTVHYGTMPSLLSSTDVSYFCATYSDKVLSVLSDAMKQWGLAYYVVKQDIYVIDILGAQSGTALNIPNIEAQATVRGKSYVEMLLPKINRATVRIATGQTIYDTGKMSIEHREWFQDEPHWYPAEDELFEGTFSCVRKDNDNPNGKTEDESEKRFFNFSEKEFDGQLFSKLIGTPYGAYLDHFERSATGVKYRVKNTAGVNANWSLKQKGDVLLFKYELGYNPKDSNGSEIWNGDEEDCDYLYSDSMATRYANALMQGLKTQAKTYTFYANTSTAYPNGYPINSVVTLQGTDEPNPLLVITNKTDKLDDFGGYSYTAVPYYLGGVTLSESYKPSRETTYGSSSVTLNPTISRRSIPCHANGTAKDTTPVRIKVSPNVAGTPVFKFNGTTLTAIAETTQQTVEGEALLCPTGSYYVDVQTSALSTSNTIEVSLLTAVYVDTITKSLDGSAGSSAYLFDVHCSIGSYNINRRRTDDQSAVFTFSVSGYTSQTVAYTTDVPSLSVVDGVLKIPYNTTATSITVTAELVGTSAPDVVIKLSGVDVTSAPEFLGVCNNIPTATTSGGTLLDGDYFVVGAEDIGDGFVKGSAWERSGTSWAPLQESGNAQHLLDCLHGLMSYSPKIDLSSLNNPATVSWFTALVSDEVVAGKLFAEILTMTGNGVIQSEGIDAQSVDPSTGYLNEAGFRIEGAEGIIRAFGAFFNNAHIDNSDFTGTISSDALSTAQRTQPTAVTSLSSSTPPYVDATVVLTSLASQLSAKGNCIGPVTGHVGPDHISFVRNFTGTKAKFLNVSDWDAEHPKTCTIMWPSKVSITLRGPSIHNGGDGPWGSWVTIRRNSSVFQYLRTGIEETHTFTLDCNTGDVLSFSAVYAPEGEGSEGPFEIYNYGTVLVQETTTLASGLNVCVASKWYTPSDYHSLILALEQSKYYQAQAVGLTVGVNYTIATSGAPSPITPVSMSAQTGTPVYKFVRATALPLSSEEYEIEPDETFKLVAVSTAGTTVLNLDNSSLGTANRVIRRYSSIGVLIDSTPYTFSDGFYTSWNFTATLSNPAVMETIDIDAKVSDIYNIGAKNQYKEIHAKTLYENGTPLSQIYQTISGSGDPVAKLNQPNTFTALQTFSAGLSASAITENGTSLANKYALKAVVEALSALIPSGATTSNQLADKAFVNSTVGTNTANYISNNGQPFTSYAQLVAYSGTVTNNDYAFVTGTDSAGNTYYDRYKYSSATALWGLEFRLNNSSFTAVQWSAISSGITSTLVASYSAHLADTSAHVSDTDRTNWNGKYTKPSGGIPQTDLNSALSDKIDTASTKAGTAVQPSSLATVATSGNYNDLNNRPTIPPAVTVDSSLSILSTNPVQNKTLTNALLGKQDTLSTQTAYTRKGTGAFVPQITTNSLGQVTGITEVPITASGPAKIPLATFDGTGKINNLTDVGGCVWVHNRYAYFTLPSGGSYCVLGTADCYDDGVATFMWRNIAGGSQYWFGDAYLDMLVYKVE